MSVKRLAAMVAVLLLALAAGTGNIIAVIDHYTAEVEYIIRMAFGG